MVMSKASTVAEYLRSLPADRRAEVTRVRRVILDHLPRGFEEGMLYGMIGYYVPLARYPETYNGQPLMLVCLAAQKGYHALYVAGINASDTVREWFEAGYLASGKKLDHGKGCLRFASADDLPLEVIGGAIARCSVEERIRTYEASRGGPTSKKARPAAPAKAARKATRPSAAKRR
jgi:hypothetical protein